VGSGPPTDGFDDSPLAYPFNRRFLKVSPRGGLRGEARDKADYGELGLTRRLNTRRRTSTIPDGERRMVQPR
jgi:hypothetical protein